ncbi:MAG: hypothetical protein MRZ79_27060 [Bacteroidia bacterium]|nr:hypothetical protein [Bacteroidia bacterium]
MSKSSILRQLTHTLLGAVFIFCTPFLAKAQDDNTEETDLDRTFMPTIQMGYVAHGTEELSGGLMTQTSIEYRDISNFIFRINYDAFNSNMRLAYPIDTTVIFTGRTTFSDLIVGVGYRQELGKHNITTYVQSGFRFYGYPVITADSAQINLDYNSRNIGIMRYSLGYEYALAPKLFFSIEFLVSHTLKSSDFWVNNPWSYGVTMGISAPII